MSDLLDVGTVVPYLRSRGQLPDDSDPAVALVAGGVSNVVLSITDADTRLVVKQAKGRLSVPGEWLATRERTLVEAAALVLTSALTPEHVPILIDVDPDALALVIPTAPNSWRCLKDDLMDGRVPLEAFDTLGQVLATWHNGTTGLTEITPACDDQKSFRQLRTDPFHRVVAAVHPDLASVVMDCADELEATRECLVHGDFSPKNILVGPDGLWVIDFEVAHIGAPVFDVAYLLTHLLLKAIHRPAHRCAFRTGADAFLARYRQEISPSLAPDNGRLLAQLGCLLLARADGRSPASYLNEPERVTLRALGRRLLLTPPTDLNGAWSYLTEIDHAR